MVRVTVVVVELVVKQRVRPRHLVVQLVVLNRLQVSHVLVVVGEEIIERYFALRRAQVVVAWNFIVFLFMLEHLLSKHLVFIEFVSRQERVLVGAASNKQWCLKRWLRSKADQHHRCAAQKSSTLGWDDHVSVDSIRSDARTNDDQLMACLLQVLVHVFVVQVEQRHINSFQDLRFL